MNNVRDREADPPGAPEEKRNISPTREEAARFNARHAMTSIEDAQRSLARAAELLAPVLGAAREHDRLLRLHGSVKREWYRVERLFQRRLVLDRQPTATDASVVQLEWIATGTQKSAADVTAIVGGAR